MADRPAPSRMALAIFKGRQGGAQKGSFQAFANFSQPS
jgi:hypothetical protein